jgi:hypothetical protein
MTSPNYQDQRQWSDQYIGEIKKIVGPYLLEESSFEVDTKQAADLVVVNSKNITIACRVRKPGFLKYANEFTIRSRYDSGCKTELQKITEGWGDWMFYGHAASSGLKIHVWTLIDLNAWRAAMIRHKDKIRRGEKSNNDGTYFAWFDIDSFPNKSDLVIGSRRIELIRTKAA